MNTNIRIPIFWVISSSLILVNALFTYINLIEWYTVGILDMSAGYPFGGEGPTPYYYRNVNLYSTVHLV